MNYFGDPALAKSLFNSVINDKGFPEFWDDYGNMKAIDGFTHLGTGCFRTALLHVESNLVYKIGNYSANVSEARNSRLLGSRSQRNLPFEVKIPRTRTYRMPDSVYRGRRFPQCVTVQECADGAENTWCDASDDWAEETPPCSCNYSMCNAKALRIIHKWSKLEDIHGENVLRDNSERFWLIDLAC